MSEVCLQAYLVDIIRPDDGFSSTFAKKDKKKRKKGREEKRTNQSFSARPAARISHTPEVHSGSFERSSFRSLPIDGQILHQKHRDHNLQGPFALIEAGASSSLAAEFPPPALISIYIISQPAKASSRRCTRAPAAKYPLVLCVRVCICVLAELQSSYVGKVIFVRSKSLRLSFPFLFSFLLPFVTSYKGKSSYLSLQLFPDATLRTWLRLVNLL